MICTCDKRPDDRKHLWSPLRKHFDMIFVDHGFIRAVYSNCHRVSAQMFRSSQPAPYQIRRWARKGVRTIVNLRGVRNCGSYLLEVEACRRYGIKLINLPIASRDVPTPEILYAAKELFETIEYPALMHCKSGADRVGFMSALYLLLHEGVPVQQAAKQLHPKYGHIRQAKTGILDFFFMQYARDMDREPSSFFDWVERRYDQKAMKQAFRSQRWANTLVDKLLHRE